MYWEYSQGTGELSLSGVKVATGYAGSGSGKNNPSMENMKNIGPIPKGQYEIQAPQTSARTGPYVLPLQPVSHDALGRTDFQIHGDSISNPGNASSGCIILPRATRERIWSSGTRNLLVIE